jgi:hypothetical protein
MKPQAVLPIGLVLTTAALLAACSSGTSTPQATPSQPASIVSTAVASPAVPIASSTSTSPVISQILGVFEGITPCDRLNKPMPQIPAEVECEMMIWKVVLHYEPGTGNPTTYEFNSTYGMSQPNTLGIAGGGTPIVMNGTWAIVKGTQADPAATVYQLNPDDPETSVSFLKVTENILHILSSDQSLMVGNGGWSYTLNRTDNGSTAPAVTIPQSGADAPVPSPLPTPSNSSVFGAFQGRMPCHEAALAFAKISLDYGCIKIKWGLTLYQDPATNRPTTFTFRGTSSTQQGTWTIVQGTDLQPGSVIYQLTPAESQQPLSFLAVDSNNIYMLDNDLNLLVGDALFSYTLSRVEPGS